MFHWGEVARSTQLEPPQRLRLAFEELGPTFIKLGQMLSTREDLLPPEWTEELKRLHASVAPVPFEEILPVIERALGRPPSEVFVDLEREPSGSASIAQVHRARLRDGREVVLKVRRPGIEVKIEADMRLLSHLARVIESEVPEARRYQPTRVVEEFRRSLIRELDLALEARNIERFARNFRDEPHILIPQVYTMWTSSLMNVQEHIDGICGEDHGGNRACGARRETARASGRRSRAQDDPGGRILSSRSAPGQRHLLAWQPARDDRPGHGRTAVDDASRPGHRFDVRHRPPRPRAHP